MIVVQVLSKRCLFSLCVREKRQKIQKINKGDGYACLAIFYMFTHHPDSCSKLIDIILMRCGWSYNIIIRDKLCTHIIVLLYFKFLQFYFPKSFTRQYGFPFETNKFQCCRYCWQYTCCI